MGDATMRLKREAEAKMLEEKLEETFSEFDEDGSGAIDVTELGSAMRMHIAAQSQMYCLCQGRGHLMQYLCNLASNNSYIEHVHVDACQGRPCPQFLRWCGDRRQPYLHVHNLFASFSQQLACDCCRFLAP